MGPRARRAGGLLLCVFFCFNDVFGFCARRWGFMGFVKALLFLGASRFWVSYNKQHWASGFIKLICVFWGGPLGALVPHGGVLTAGDEFTMDDQMLMELLALGIDAKMSVRLDGFFGDRSDRVGTGTWCASTLFAVIEWAVAVDNSILVGAVGNHQSGTFWWQKTHVLRQFHEFHGFHGLLLACLEAC